MNNANETDRTDLVEIDECVHCGRRADEHCIFEAAKVPDGCRCDYRSWDGIPGPICDKFEGHDDGKHCENCEHNRECHRE